MEELMQPKRLRARILLWVDEETKTNSLPPKSGQLMEAVLYRGEMPRGDVATQLEMSERSARRIISSLLDKGVLRSESSRAPLHLAFPAAIAGRWMPDLFPDHVVES